MKKNFFESQIPGKKFLGQGACALIALAAFTLTGCGQITRSKTPTAAAGPQLQVAAQLLNGIPLGQPVSLNGVSMDQMWLSDCTGSGSQYQQTSLYIHFGQYIRWQSTFSDSNCSSAPNLTPVELGTVQVSAQTQNVKADGSDAYQAVFTNLQSAQRTTTLAIFQIDNDSNGNPYINLALGTAGSAAYPTSLSAAVNFTGIGANANPFQ